MTNLTKQNATKMTAFWKVLWAAKSANNQELLSACERMVEAASKRKPASDSDFALVCKNLSTD